VRFAAALLISFAVCGLSLASCGGGSDREDAQSVLDVCEHEMRALEALRDPRLSGVLQAMTTFRAELVAALATFMPDAGNGR